MFQKCAQKFYKKLTQKNTLFVHFFIIFSTRADFVSARQGGAWQKICYIYLQIYIKTCNLLRVQKRFSLSFNVLKDENNLQKIKKKSDIFWGYPILHLSRFKRKLFHTSISDAFLLGKKLRDLISRRFAS